MFPISRVPLISYLLHNLKVKKPAILLIHWKHFPSGESISKHAFLDEREKIIGHKLV